MVEVEDGGEFFLRSAQGCCPDISLALGEKVVLGRGPRTGIKDRRLSRHQVSVQCCEEDVLVEQLGPNNTIVAGKALLRGAIQRLLPGQKLELLKDCHCFILMAPGVKKVKSVPADDGSGRLLEPEHSGVRNNWATGLRVDIRKPELVVTSSPTLVVIKDKFPKARHHYLVLPRADMDNLQSLGRQHLGLLQEMKELGQEMACRHPESEFRLGFHAVPSMVQLHLHCISQDFDSVSLKKKLHWNSFTSDYFLPIEKVVAELKEKGEVVKKTDMKYLLDLPLSCHKCDEKPKNMPELKKHIITHQ